MTERKATEKTEAYMNKSYAEGLTPRTIAKKMKADPELTSLDHSTVHRHVVPGYREKNAAAVKKYRGTVACQ